MLVLGLTDSTAFGFPWVLVLTRMIASTVRASSCSIERRHMHEDLVLKVGDSDVNSSVVGEEGAEVDNVWK